MTECGTVDDLYAAMGRRKAELYLEAARLQAEAERLQTMAEQVAAILAAARGLEQELPK